MDEQMLRRALMEASLERFRDVLEGADRDWNWSPRYLRSRTRLLADPFGWAKRMARPVWKRAVRAAACAALACLVTLGGLMAVSPTVRAAVLGWLREITENGIFYTASGNWDEAAYPELPDWTLAELPEGWALDSVRDLGSGTTKEYRNGNKRVSFQCSYPVSGTVGWGTGNPETVEGRREVTINGYTAELYTEEDHTLLTWQDENGVLFYFNAYGVDPDALVEMAVSAQPVETEIPSYMPVWLPDGYTIQDTSEGSAAAHETIWTGNGGSITLLCADTPLELPEEEPETVDVNGGSGQFWPAKEPHEAEKQEPVVVGDIVISSYTVSGPQSADSSTLAWMDKDTGVYFRLHGTEGRDTLLHVAASITEATEEQNTTDSFGG